MATLLTGVTGGLGAKILDDMLHVHNVSASNIVTTSRSESNRARFESQGLIFRVADYVRIDC
jgi:thioester reductase-like protein